MSSTHREPRRGGGGIRSPYQRAPPAGEHENPLSRSNSSPGGGVGLDLSPPPPPPTTTTTTSASASHPRRKKSRKPPKKSRSDVSTTRGGAERSRSSHVAEDADTGAAPVRMMQRAASHLSLMMGDSGGETASRSRDVVEDTHSHANLHQAMIMRSSAVWRRRLAVFTAVFIAVTVMVRWDERHEERVKEAEQEEEDGVGAGVGAVPEWIEDVENTRQSCGEFFEPNPIMKLKNSSTVESMQNGIVAADDRRCSELGMTILRDRGGNAVDAAIATTLCLGVVNPASSGIGGGGFIMVHSEAGSHAEKVGHEDYKSPEFDDMRSNAPKPSEEVKIQESSIAMHELGGLLAQEGITNRGRKVTEMIDCRETAPSASTFDMYEKLSPKASIEGGLAIAVPGELRGLELAHSRHGLLPWSDVVQPAMELARDGFRISEHLSHDIAKNEAKILRHESLARLLTKNHDEETLLEEGDILKRPELAETLRLIMKGGADAMYTGEMANIIARDIQDAGGIITADDIANYRPAVRDPLIARDVAGFTLVGPPPPSSGGATVIGAARFLSGYADPFASFADTLSKHRFVEACKHVFALRMSLSDPAFDAANVTARVVADLVGGSYMEEMRRKTLDHTVLRMSEYGGARWAQLNDGDGEQGELKDAHEGDRRRRRNLRLFNYLEDHGTTHLSVVDKDRNAVTITSTVNTYFGSKVLSPSTGIIMNNQMDDFATPGRPNFFGLQPSEANYISPGKRPLSSMSPTLVFRRDYDEKTPENDLGKFFMALGASGGPKIITSVLQVFLNYAVLGMPLFDSVANPRVHDQLLYHGKAATTYDRMKLIQGPLIAVSPRTLEALAKRNHKLLPVDYLGTAQVVAADLETGHLTGVSDIRKEGCPAGY